MNGSPMNCPPPSTPLAKLAIGCRYALAAVFLAAAIGKLVDLADFESRLVFHSPLPQTAAILVARILPWLEWTIGWCLLTGFVFREARWMAIAILAAFTVYIAILPESADCGCTLFPMLETQPGKVWLLVRNIALLAIGTVSLWDAHKKT